VLPQFARMKDEAFAEYMVEILTDHEAAKGKLPNKHDLIKMYAARALREYLPVVAIDPDQTELGPQAAKRKAREMAYVDALTKFIERPGMDKLADDEKAAMRFVRREVIETLAQTKAPSIVSGTAKIEGPIVPTLLKVLSPKGGLDLAPDLSERLEAAIGVCQMNLKYAGEYQGELGLHLVAMFVADFARAYNQDFSETGPDTKKPRRWEWRVQSKRLEEALKDMTKNAKGQPYAAKAKELEDYASVKLFPPMYAKNQTQVNQNDINLFGDEAKKLRPRTMQVYRTVKAYVIDAN
jgi:hypothetical protein